MCGRPRCASDAQLAPGRGCLVCQGAVEAGAAVASAHPGDGRDARAQPRAPTAAQVVAAALLCTGLALAGGAVLQEYVGAGVFSLVTPAVLGVLCALTVERVAPLARSPLLTGVALVYALVGVALGFVLEGSRTAVSPLAQVAPPYLAAGSGVVVWELLTRGLPPWLRR